MPDFREQLEALKLEESNANSCEEILSVLSNSFRLAEEIIVAYENATITPTDFAFVGDEGIK